jgi:hypothetical protein
VTRELACSAELEEEEEEEEEDVNGASLHVY